MIRAGVRAIREMVSLTRDLKDLRVLVVSGAVGTLGAGLLSPVLPVYLESRGLDLERIGVVFTLGSLLPLFLQPVLGGLSDRFSRKGFLIGISVTTSLLVPAFTLLERPSLLAAALAAKLMLDRSQAPISSAMVGDLAPARHRATVFGLLSSAVNLVFVAALVASSAAVALLGAARLLDLAGALFLASSLVLLALSGERPRAAASGGGGAASGGSGLDVARSSLLAPLAYLRRDPSLRALFAYQFFFIFALDLFPIYLPLFAVSLGASQAMVGPLIASSWLVYAAVQPFGGRLSDRQAGRKTLIGLGLAGMTACCALLGLSGWLPRSCALAIMTAAWVLLAIPDGLFRPSADALVVDLAPPGERGRFLGALGSATALANIVAPLLYGVVARRASLGCAFLLSSGAFLAALATIGRVREPASGAAPLLTTPLESR